VGVFANSLGIMYSSVLHAGGRSDLTARLHILELPFYISSLLILINLHGLKGAALAWVGRMVVDAFAIFLMAKKHAH
jgi:hypothetical protein